MISLSSLIAWDSCLLNCCLRCLHSPQILDELIAEVHDDAPREAFVAEPHSHINAGIVKVTNDAENGCLLTGKTLAHIKTYLKNRYYDENEGQKLF